MKLSNTPISSYKQDVSEQQDYIKVYVSTNRFYLLSYHHLDYAEYESNQGNDTLILSFLSHRVRITGTRLTELVDGIQARKIVWVRAIPERYLPTKTEESGVVEFIEIEKSE